jgi:tetratricopeptide (TPR) repeat protein
MTENRNWGIVVVFKKAGLFLLVVWQICGIAAYAEENYKNRYLELLRNNRYDELKSWLEQWESAEPKNPELYIGYFNYYVRLGAVQGTGTIWENGQLVYVPKIIYQIENVNKGIEYLDRGLRFTPNRIDMYWGKLELLMEIDDYARAGKTLYDLIELSPRYNNEWLLADNRRVQNGAEYFCNYIVRFFSRATEANIPASMEMVRVCGEKLIKVYPRSIYGYNIMGNYYFIAGKKEEALNSFLSAEKINNRDCIILINIGRMHAELGNSSKAREYFRKVLDIGNGDEKRMAQYYLDSL